ncbi:MAG: hypothetical protein D6786_06030 [Gammaproteobacteria bacterium]|nr:MAG: hypothetical protein D6786_06030 [Gammaproteobacteria bacterium]
MTPRPVRGCGAPSFMDRPTSLLSAFRTAHPRLLPGSLLLLSLLLQAPSQAADDLSAALRTWQRQDFGHAREQLLRLAEQGNARAHLLLGLGLERGLGVPADPARALTHYRLAAEAGDPLAALILGNRHYLGQGTAPDPVAAVRWWREAAEGGLPQARYNLGLAYLRGEGTGRNLAEAVMWLRLAAEAGLARARETLATLYEEGIGVPRDPQQAARWRAAATEPPAGEVAVTTPAGSPAGEGKDEVRGETATVAHREGSLHGPDWVMRRPAGHYTLQLASGPDRAAILALLERLEGLPDRAWLRSRYPSGKTVYLALLGDYPDLESARSALRELPPSLRQRDPWIRSFALLQKSQMEQNAPGPDPVDRDRSGAMDPH